MGEWSTQTVLKVLLTSILAAGCMAGREKQYMLPDGEVIEKAAKMADYILDHYGQKDG